MKARCWDSALRFGISVILLGSLATVTSVAALPTLTTTAFAAETPSTAEVLYVRQPGVTTGVPEGATVVNSLAAAAAKASRDSSIKTIDIQGNLTLSSSSSPIFTNCELYFSGNTDIGPAQGVTLPKGISLLGSSSVSTATGASVVFHDLDTALNVGNSSDSTAVISDGTYIFRGNKISVWVQNTGKIEGTARDKLTISVSGELATDTARNIQYGVYGSKDAQFRNATINIEGNYTPGGAKPKIRDGRFNLTNVSLNFKNVLLSRMYGSIFTDSTVTVDDSAFNSPKSPAVDWVNQLGFVDTLDNSTFHVIGGPMRIGNGDRNNPNHYINVINNSHLIVEGSTNGGVYVMKYSGTTGKAYLNLIDSSIELRDGSGPALIATGGAINIFGASTLTGPASSINTLLGASDDGSIVITGGSFNLNPDSYTQPYEATSFMNGGVTHYTTPTNGEDNGNEGLKLFTLSDTSISSLTLLNASGTSYSYTVPNTSTSHNVYAPSVQITFTLNDPSGNTKVNAHFADGTTADKTREAIRGLAANTASLAGVVSPYDGEAPEAAGYDFVGYFYKDASGNEQAFDFTNTALTSNTLVYAKWSPKSSTATLQGDLLVNGNTTHTEPLEASAGSDLTVETQLNFAPVAEQLTTLAQNWENDSNSNASLALETAELKLAITLPEGVVAPSNLSDALTLEGWDGYVVTSATQEGSTLVFSLKPQSLPTSYDELAALLPSEDVTLTLSDLSLDNQVSAGTTLSVSANVTGSFKGSFTDDAGFSYPLNLAITAEQSESGSDAAATDTSLRASLSIVNKPTSEPSIDASTSNSTSDETHEADTNKATTSDTKQLKPTSAHSHVTPKTGDYFNAVAVAIVAVVGIAGIVASILLRRKGKNNTASHLKR